MNKPITSVTNGPVEFPPNTLYWSFHCIVQTQSFMCPSRRQNRSPLISDCFHMLSETVKKIQSSLNRDYVGHFISASLPSGRKREWECARNHLICSLLSLSKSPAAYFEIQQSSLPTALNPQQQSTSSTDHSTWWMCECGSARVQVRLLALNNSLVLESKFVLTFVVCICVQS